MTAAVRLAVAIAGFVGYYWLVKGWLAVPARRLADVLGPRLDRPSNQVYALVKTLLSILTQGALAVALLALLPQARTGLSLRGLAYTPGGVLLGAAESAAAIAVCELLIRAYGGIKRAAARPITARVWTDYSRGGWMGLLRTIQASYPRPVGYAVVWGQVTCEEVMFRQCIPAFIGLAAAGVWISAGMFVVMQVFGMKTWQAAAFPVVGALVMGIAHAWIYLAVPLILPLIVAHACGFLFASRPG